MHNLINNKMQVRLSEQKKAAQEKAKAEEKAKKESGEKTGEEATDSKKKEEK